MSSPSSASKGEQTRPPHQPVQPPEHSHAPEPVRPPAQPPGETQQCPQCNATIPVLKGYDSWCEHCGWNVKPYDPNPPRNVLERKYVELGEKLSRQLLEQMRDIRNLRPTLTPSLLAAFALSCLVHLFDLTLALLGVLLLFSGYCGLFVLGIVFVVVAFLIRPRMPKAPRGKVLPRGSFPVLYGIADEVARSVGAPAVDEIRAGDTFNASFSLVGWRRKRVMRLGLPLFSILTPQERVALLGHELGHCVNGDITRTLVVNIAIKTLVDWYGILHPGSIWRRAGTITGWAGIATIPTNMIMMGLAQMARLWINALVNLLWSDTQRAEYLADALGARAAGTGATVSALDKMYLVDTVKAAVHRVAISDDSDKMDLFAEFRRYASRVPEREWERLRRTEALDNSRLDSTHPPTAYRLELLRAHPVAEPAVVLQAEDSEEIDRELGQVSRGVQKAILEDHIWAIT